MTEYIPTLDEVRDKYADARVGIGEWTRFDESVKQAVESAYAEFDRWLASVERAAAEKAWREGELAGTRNQRDCHLYQQAKITETEYERRVNERANPYRAEAYRQEREDHGSDI